MTVQKYLRSVISSHKTNFTAVLCGFNPDGSVYFKYKEWLGEDPPKDVANLEVGDAETIGRRKILIHTLPIISNIIY